jgi:MraZ protein
MGQFSGYFLNKLDQKGRVSVPSTYRDVLKLSSRKGDKDMPLAPVVLRPSHQQPCIEGWTETAYDALKAHFDSYDLFSEDYEDLSVALFGDAMETATDSDGRIIVPDYMREHAGLPDTVMFIGGKDKFQLWEPEAGRRRLAEAKARIKSLTLKTGRQA